MFVFTNIEKTKEITTYIEMNNETSLIGTLNFMNFTTILDSKSIVPICSEPSFIDDFNIKEPKELKEEYIVNIPKY